MKYVLGILALWLGLFLSPAFAAAPPPSVGQVKLDLLKQLENDGYLSSKLTQEAKQKYVSAQELGVPTASATQLAAQTEPSFLYRYLSWASFFKLIAIICLLVAFSGFLANLAKGLMFLIIAVPKEVYQTGFLAVSGTLTFAPQFIWASQSFYLALFGALATPMVLAWVIESHPKLMEKLAQLFSFGIPAMSVVSFWGMLYFGGLAVMYQSQIFGFFAAVCLSGILSFGMYYRPGVLTMYFNKKATSAVILGHLVVLAGYCIVKVTGHLPASGALFDVGLQYYCTIAMGIGFLVGASPFERRSGRAGAWLVLFTLVTIAAVTGYFIYDLKVIGSIMCVIAVLLALEWIGYIGYQAGFLFGTFILGVTLYVGSLLLEHYASFFVLRLA